MPATGHGSLGPLGVAFSTDSRILAYNENHYGAILLWDIASRSAKGPQGSPPAHRITMLKRSASAFGKTLGMSTGWVHRIELARNGVAMIKDVEYRRIDAAGVHIAIDGKEQCVPADTVILCAGQEPRRELLAGCEARGRKPHLIGGAKEAGELDAKRAMLEGAQLAASL